MFLILQGDMMRLSPYLKHKLKEASQEAFANAKIILFGSRIDDAKQGGDFDLAVVGDMDKEHFKKAKVKFFKYLMLQDLDLPIDLVLYNRANTLLKKEIDKGEVL